METSVEDDDGAGRLRRGLSGLGSAGGRALTVLAAEDADHEAADEEVDDDDEDGGETTAWVVALPTPWVPPLVFMPK